MIRVLLTGSAARAWRNAALLPRAKRDLLFDVWITILDLQERGVLETLRVGQRLVVRMSAPPVNIYVRRTQISEAEVYRIAIPHVA